MQSPCPLHRPAVSPPSPPAPCPTRVPNFRLRHRCRPAAAPPRAGGCSRRTGCRERRRVAIWRGRGAARVIPRTSCRWSSRGARPGGAGDGTTSRNGRKRTDHHTFCADKVLEIQPMVIQQPSLPLQDRWQGPTAAETVSPAPRHTKYSMSSNHGNLSQNTWQAGDHYHRSLWIHGEIARKCSVSASRPDTRNRRPPRWEDGGWNDKAGGRPSPPLAGAGRPHMGARAVCSWPSPPSGAQ